MREARLARPRPGAAADDRGRRGAVVRRAERPARDQRPLGRQQPATEWIRVTSSASRGSSGGRIAGSRRPEHRLARPGRAGEQQVVAAGGGELERAPGALLAANVGEVG